jgi:hypothetical protein
MTSAFQPGWGNQSRWVEGKGTFVGRTTKINGKLHPFTCFQPGLDREYEYCRSWPEGTPF